jgi:hypothetical protein
MVMNREIAFIHLKDKSIKIFPVSLDLRRKFLDCLQGEKVIEARDKENLSGTESGQSVVPSRPYRSLMKMHIIATDAGEILSVSKCVRPKRSAYEAPCP